MLSKVLFLLVLLRFSSARRHELDLKNDDRQTFPISTFGFYSSGYLQVEVARFRISPNTTSEKFGFSLEKTSNPYTDTHPELCLLNQPIDNKDSMVQHVYFNFDLKNKQLYLNCSNSLVNLTVSKDLAKLEDLTTHSKLSDHNLFNPPQRKRSIIPALELSAIPIGHLSRNKREALPDPTTSPDETITEPVVQKLGQPYSCSNVKIPMDKDPITGAYNFSFIVIVRQANEEGLYNLNFHNCHNYDNGKRASINMKLKVTERNPDDNYLSAGEMPLPALYFMMALLFLLSACFWFFLLKKSKDPVFKIHYLMGVLVVIKSFSLLFHGVNYHFIQTKGVHMEAWAVMYYIMHLLKGALLFTILALIGSGWAFIKHVLSNKEKKIFMMVVPLQIIANVALIIVEETEEASAEHAMWGELLFLLDFLCCGAILLPVVWSIRHLQEASQTDGKAATNLRKLKLFRHFYIMVVCYIYFTRIIVYLLRITVPFQYEWLDDMFKEMATYVFFVLTGYKFRPANNNPYFRLAFDDDEDMDEVLTTTGLTESLTRVNQKGKEKEKELSTELIEVYDDDEEIDLLNTRESSHAFD